jgi:hypothetical protein
VANADRLHITLSFIKANPDLWDQGSPLHSFAAIAVELAGYNVLPSAWVWLPGRLVWLTDAAAEVLELTGPQSRRLFAPNNTLADLQQLVAEFTRRPGGTHLRLVR